MTTDKTILFTCNNSVYDMLLCDTYDIDRNALSCKVNKPCIYHPPCATWGRLRMQSINRPGEHLLSVWSILNIWRYGGVLEHPAGSKLWDFMELSKPGSKPDIHGGISISLDQHWFGHKCKKNTWIYIVGLSANEIPAMPLNFNAITHKICSSKPSSNLKELSKQARHRTPAKLAFYLIDIIELINNKKLQK
jgi:hypothetical protein